MIPLPAIRASNTGRALLAGYAAFCVLYLGAAALAPAARVTLEPSRLDAAIPFLPWTIWVYFSQFVLLVVALTTARDDGLRTLGFYAMLLATLLAAAVFAAWPTQVERAAAPSAGISGLAWAALHASDTPANCFPSLHVALAALSGALLWRRGWRIAAVLWPFAIAVSTLTTKQHVAWDIPGGLALAAIAWVLVPRVVQHERTATIPHGARP
jgi:PAP2 superfamily